MGGSVGADRRDLLRCAAVLSGLMAGGGRVCRVVAGMGGVVCFLSVERRIVTGNDKK